MTDRLGRLFYGKLTKAGQQLEAKVGAGLVRAGGVSDPGLALGACAVFTDGDGRKMRRARLRRRWF